MSYIFRSTEEVKKCKQKYAHNGKGEIIVQQLLGDLKGSDFPGFPDDFESPVNFVHKVVLPPNSSIGTHPHDNNEEFYYVISGSGQMKVDKDVFIMNEGSICLIKKGSKHSFENISDKDVIVLVMEVEFSK